MTLSMITLLSKPPKPERHCDRFQVLKNKRYKREAIPASTDDHTPPLLVFKRNVTNNLLNPYYPYHPRAMCFLRFCTFASQLFPSCP